MLSSKKRKSHATRPITEKSGRSANIRQDDTEALLPASLEYYLKAAVANACEREEERYCEMPATRGSKGARALRLGSQQRITRIALRGLWITGFLIAVAPRAYAQLTWTPIFVSGKSKYNIYINMVHFVIIFLCFFCFLKKSFQHIEKYS